MSDFSRVCQSGESFWTFRPCHAKLVGRIDVISLHLFFERETVEFGDLIGFKFHDVHYVDHLKNDFFHF